jgi:ribosomal protein L40E
MPVGPCLQKYPRFIFIILEAYGIEEEYNVTEHTKNILKAKTCQNCNEPNKPDAQFCIKCRMVLSYSAYTETLDKQKERDEEISLLKSQVTKMMNTLENIVTATEREKETKKRWLAKDFIDNGMYVPK